MPSWYNTRWQYRIKISVDHTKVTAVLTDFPVYLNLDNLPDLTFWAHVQASGADVRITTSDGTTEVPREIVACDNDAKIGEVHFKAPTLSSSADTDFYIYYGYPLATEPAATDTYGSQNVWTGYDLVAHLKGSTTDSSANGWAITENGSYATVTTDRFGNASSAYELDATDVEDKIQVDSSPNLGEVGDHTYSIWMKANVLTNSAYVFCHYNWRFLLSGTGGVAQFAAGRMTNGAGPTYNVSTVSTINISDWAKLTAIYHPDAGGSGYIKIYLNGVYQASTSIGSLAIWADYGNRDLQWGNSGHGAAVPFQGKVGHSDVYSGVQSDERILAEYANQNSPVTFYTVAAEEGVPITTMPGVLPIVLPTLAPVLVLPTEISPASLTTNGNAALLSTETAPVMLLTTQRSAVL